MNRPRHIKRNSPEHLAKMAMVEAKARVVEVARAVAARAVAARAVAGLVRGLVSS